MHRKIATKVLFANAVFLGMTLTTTTLAGAEQVQLPMSPGQPLATLQNPISGYQFGWSVATAGSTVIVGDPLLNASEKGVAFIYVKGSSGWPASPAATLKDPAKTKYDEFGDSVSVSGSTAVVGAQSTDSSDGAAYIYVRTPTGWPTKPTVTLKDPVVGNDNYFGSSVSVSGSTLVVGASGVRSQGAAYIYVKGSSGWRTKPATRLHDPAATTGDEFGASVSVSGSVAVVGAQGLPTSVPGAAYLYVKGTSSWPARPTMTLQNPQSSGRFGASVSVSGSTAMVGSPDNSTGGLTYIYAASGSHWSSTPEVTLNDPVGNSDDYFGDSVAISGSTALVGASGTTTGSQGGATYFYEASSSSWSTVPSVTIDDPAGSSPEDQFGAAVALSNATGIVGAAGAGPGMAYIYTG